MSDLSRYLKISALALAAGATLSACVVAPAPMYGRPAPYVAPYGGSIGVAVGGPAVMVDVAPPPPRYEPIPYAPFPGAIWIGGYWGWNGGRHVWVPGRYEHPRPGYDWHPHEWAQHDGHWQLHEGHWEERGRR